VYITIHHPPDWTGEQTFACITAVSENLDTDNLFFALNQLLMEGYYCFGLAECSQAEDTKRTRSQLDNPKVWLLGFTHPSPKVGSKCNGMHTIADPHNHQNLWQTQISYVMFNTCMYHNPHLLGVMCKPL
jgi:hypothetical protein